ncbi:MAG: S-adenosylmethionine:tRNA ribosyltransferase-isomerase [Bacteroidales bacterium]|nr:S-adenosylmethionine:tRNA ribosyltransferase-isomerase [Bacteroidales bacterium]
MALIDDIRALRIADYDYNLPDERIAKHPLAQREQCKLLYYKGGNIEERKFWEVPALLPKHSTLIYNNTRVINARLRFRKETGSTIEIFCLEPVMPRDYEQIFQTTGHCVWQCLVGNSKRWKQGPLTQTLTIQNGTQGRFFCPNSSKNGTKEPSPCPITLTATRGEQRGNAWEIAFDWDDETLTFADVLDAVGEIPIPPYLNRGTEASDSTDYQTVYSHIDGSVAAPTAGLHFTDEVLAECDTRGISRREITLHVGAGTFQPVKSEHIGDHPMHYEFISVPRDVILDIINSQGPIIAVGTTSVRTLESLYYIGQTLEDNPDADEQELTVTQWMPYTTPCEISTQKALQNIVDYLDRHRADTYMGSTQLMIAPGFQYRIVDGMITNFHQPQSTLLLLVAAFVGNDQWRGMYDYAMSHDFRFLSYGDAQLLLR